MMYNTNNKEKMLGYIRLETGPKLIIPMNDIFINFTFQDEANWENLKMMANIIYNQYAQDYESTKIKPIEEIISVRTQFPYFKAPKSDKPKAPDIRIEDINKFSFIDFENNPHSSKPLVPIRSTEYLGFALSRGKVAKQQFSMWLLNGAVSILLNGKSLFRISSLRYFCQFFALTASLVS